MAANPEDEAPNAQPATKPRPKWKRAAAALAFGFVAFNLVAFMQAWSMLHFSSNPEPRGGIETLSFAQKAALLVSGVRVPRPRNMETPDAHGLQYSTHTIEVSTRVKLEAWRIPRDGARGMIVMFHGYAASKWGTLPEAKAFHELGYECLLVDFRGSGGSSRAYTTIGFREAEDVAAALKFARGIAPEGKPVVLHGVSMGAAAIARACAKEGARPDGVILEAVFDRMLRTVKNRFEMMGVPAFPGAHALVFWGGLQFGFWGFANNPESYARSIECPALVMHGTADMRARVEEGERVYAAIRGEKRFVKFEGLGHESYFRARPEEWKGAVGEFLETIGKAKPIGAAPEDPPAR